MQTAKDTTIVILGISEKPDRYSYKAAKMLASHGYHSLIGVAPSPVALPEVRYAAHLSEIKEAIDTLTVYVNPQLLATMTDDILKLAPKRIIFNPGTEHEAFAHEARQKGIEVLEACTLVLLSTGQY